MDHLDEFLLPLSIFDELTRLTNTLPFASSRSDSGNQLLCEDFEQSALSIARQLASITIPLTAQIWADSISVQGLDPYQEERTSQHIYQFSRLNPSLPHATYRAWSTSVVDTDPLQFEMCLIDIRDLKTYKVTVPLNLTAEQATPPFMTLLHEAAISLGEEKLDPLVILGMKENILQRYQPLLRKYPEIKNCHPPLTENACKSIEDLKTKKADINPSWLEFETLLLFYPDFAKKWDAYIAPMPPETQETVGIALFEFIKTLKLEFRKATLALGKALPLALEEPFGKKTQELAALGHLYPIPSGLSLLPERDIYRTPQMLTTYAVQNEFDFKEIPLLISTMQTQQDSDEPISMEGKFPLNRALIPGQVHYKFDLLPQGDERVPLNELRLTLKLGMSRAKPVSHIVRYGQWISDEEKLKQILKWHLLMLFSKAHAEILRLETEHENVEKKEPEEKVDEGSDGEYVDEPDKHLIGKTVVVGRLARPKMPKPAAAAAHPDP
jgi:hypothetical protein